MPPGLCTCCSPCQKHLSFLSLLGYVFLLKAACLGKRSLTLLDKNRCTCYKLRGIQLHTPLLVAVTPLDLSFMTAGP